MTTNRIRSGVATAVAALALLSGPPARSQSNVEPLTITGHALSMSTIAPGTTAAIEITIRRWSTPEERAHLIETMVDKGDKALLNELQRAPVHGRFSVPGLSGPDPHQLRLGHDLRYAWQRSQPDGGRQIVIMTDRYIGFEEARAQPRTTDYPFTLIEIRVDKNGEGQGKLALATKIRFDKAKNNLDLENFDSEPVRLQNLKVKTGK
jgi:hypothetical protein